MALLVIDCAGAATICAMASEPMPYLFSQVIQPAPETEFEATFNGFDLDRIDRLLVLHCHDDTPCRKLRFQGIVTRLLRECALTIERTISNRITAT